MPSAKPLKTEKEDVKIKFVYETPEKPTLSFSKLVQKRANILKEYLYNWMHDMVVDEEIR